MTRELVGEDAQGAGDERGRPIGMLARAAAGQLPRPPDDVREVVVVRRARRREARRRIGDGSQAEDARPALRALTVRPCSRGCGPSHGPRRSRA